MAITTRKTVLPVAAGFAVLLGVGLVADIRGFDRTSGGYEPPYTDFVGEPIDWSAMDATAEGMRKPGYVVSVAVDCTSGMMHFETLGLRIPFREFSPRALAVHKPREACEARGIAPAF